MDLKSTLRRFLPKETPRQTHAQPRVPNLDPFLHGREMDTPFGPCYLVERHFAFGDAWGDYRISTVGSELPSAGLSILGAGVISTLSTSRTVFLDTETTGLAGGTGTYAFLVGTGRFTESGFLVQQFLMRDYNEELALLYAVDQELQSADAIVSFNGKTFDIPLLKTRFAISRMDFEGVNRHCQVDLLHLARRLWRDKLPSCSLESLESHILGLTRYNDIPGYEIPQRFFLFLQTGDGRLLKDILEHNVLDLVSMAVLMEVINNLGKLTPSECDCPWVAEALGQIYANDGKLLTALQFLEQAWNLAQQKEQQIRILRTAALLHKRRKDYETAALFWQRLLVIAEDDLMAHEELAKHYEHRHKDFEEASRITRRALAIALRTRPAKVPDLEHRLHRINRRQETVS